MNSVTSFLKLVLIVIILGGVDFSVSLAADDLPKGDPSNGSRLWVSNCTRCHNVRSAEELRDDQWKTTMFHMRIRAQLTGQETRDILAFLQLSNSPSDGVEYKEESVVSVTELSGQQLYNQTCIACHGGDGKGAISGVPDFTLKNGRLSKNDVDLITSIKNGLRSKGSSMAMPPKGGNPSLNDNQIEAILKYIRSSFQ